MGSEETKSEDYTSKSKRNECKNEGCVRERRTGSAYCSSCSENYKSKK